MQSKHFEINDLFVGTGSAAVASVDLNSFSHQIHNNIFFLSLSGEVKIKGALSQPAVLFVSNLKRSLEEQL